MPELPEVETLKQDLKKVEGKIIKQVSVDWPKLVLPLSVKSFTTKLKNKKIISVDRRAKMLILELSSSRRSRNSSATPRINSSASRYILIHLKMTGQLIYQPKHGKVIIGGHPQTGGSQGLPNKFTHIILEFKDGSHLFFNDVRKFGWMKLVDKNGLAASFAKYGVEPLTKDFSLARFEQILSRYPNRKVKQLLGDQSLIAGLGNIYLDESCFAAKILPTRRVASLAGREIKALHQVIPKVLKFAIAKKGTSFSDYIRLDGKEGQMVKWLKVYNKKGQQCQRCGSVIKKIKLNQRGTHFCSNCQH